MVDTRPRRRPPQTTKAIGLARLALVLARAVPDRAGGWLHHPVFIVGCGRSGTTLLRQTLASHPQIAAFPTEADALWHPRLLPWPTSEEPAPPIWDDPVRFTQLSLALWPPDQGLRLRAVFGAYQRMAGGAVFVQKNIKLNFMLGHVRALFPDARFIHMLRDGRAVAPAYARKMRATIRFAPRRFRREGYDLPPDVLLERFARYWTLIVLTLDADAAALGLAGTPAWCEVRYEEFTADPAGTLGRLAAWLGVDPGYFGHARLPDIRSTNRQIIDRLSAEQRAQVERVLAPALLAKGYLTP